MRFFRNKKYALILLAAIAIAGIIVGIPVLAQETGLVPCGTSGGRPCDVCDIFVLLKTVLDKLWNPFAIVIAAAMLLYGGFLMLLPSFGSGSSAMHSRGVKVLTNTLVGLVIVFFAWVGVDTIIKVVAGGMNSITSSEPGRLFPAAQISSDFGPWNAIRCKRAPDRTPINLINIPPELQCPAGATSKIVGDVWDACDPNVQRAFSSDSSVKGVASGQCKSSNISNLNQRYGSQIDSIAAQEGVDPKLLRAVILTESSGDPNAQSPAGACGIAQVMPTTAGLSCQQLKDPATGIRAGAQVLRKLAASPSTKGKQAYVLIGYNGGARALEPSRDCTGQVKGECTINPGGYRETLNYVPKVQGCLNSL